MSEQKNPVLLGYATPSIPVKEGEKTKELYALYRSDNREMAEAVGNCLMNFHMVADVGHLLVDPSGKCYVVVPSHYQRYHGTIEKIDAMRDGFVWALKWAARQEAVKKKIAAEKRRARLAERCKSFKAAVVAGEASGFGDDAGIAYRIPASPEFKVLWKFDDNERSYVRVRKVRGKRRASVNIKLDYLSMVVYQKSFAFDADDPRREMLNELYAFLDRLMIEHEVWC